MKRIAALACALAPGPVSAHPVHEVVQSAYLTLAPGEVRLQLDMTPGADVAGIVIDAVDADGDGAVTDAEAAAYGQSVLAQSQLVLDGVETGWTLQRVAVPAIGDIADGAGVIEIHAVAARPDGAGGHSLDYRNHYEPAEAVWTANVFLKPGPDLHYDIGDQQRTPDGHGLTVRYAVVAP